MVAMPKGACARLTGVLFCGGGPPFGVRKRASAFAPASGAGSVWQNEAGLRACGPAVTERLFLAAASLAEARGRREKSFGTNGKRTVNER